MGVIIVDSEYESGAFLIDNAICEILELGQRFSEELSTLSENGFQDVLIDNAIIEKSSQVYSVLLKIEETAKDISGSLKGFLKEADETDSYLY